LGWATNAFDAYVEKNLGRGSRAAEATLEAALAKMDFARTPPGDRPYFDVARTYAWVGRADKARTWLARYDADVRDTARKRQETPYRLGILGDVLMAERKFKEALDAYRKSDRLPDGPADPCNI